MSQDTMQSLAVALFSEVMAADQAIRNRLGKVLPKGMELSHFSVLNHLVRVQDGQTPLVLARTFQVPKTSMTHTLAGLEGRGPDGGGEDLGGVHPD